MARSTGRSTRGASWSAPDSSTPTCTPAIARPTGSSPTPGGRLTRVVDEAAGQREFEAAIEFVRRVDGGAGGRVRGLLAPREVETCSLDLLRATRKAADDLRMPIVTHAAYNVHEFFQIVTEHRLTPIELLDSLGFLGRDVTIGHGNLIAENRLLSYSGGRDLEIMGSRGVTVSHCPVNIARRGRSL